MTQDIKLAAQRKGSFIGTLRAVLWGFLGVRKKSAFETESETINPIHLIIIGIISALLFILSIYLIVKLIITHTTT